MHGSVQYENRCMNIQSCNFTIGFSLRGFRRKSRPDLNYANSTQ